MAQPEETLANSPVDFDSAVAYALHPEMRRLLIVYAVGSLLLPVGLSLLIGGGFEPVLVRVVELVAGIAIALVGATLFFGGLVGALFKIVADANILAESQYSD
jgi:hypothetical protein